MPYRRNIFLINKGFQLRFAFYVCSWIFALSLVYPLIIYNLFDYFFRYVALDPMGPPLGNLQHTRREILWSLVLLQLVFLGITFLISMFMSHRIAGPLYKLRRFFEDVKKGDLNQELNFRKKDHFHDLAKGYNSMMKEVRGAVGKTGETLLKAIPSIEKAIEHSDAEGKKHLEQALSVLRASKRD